MLEVQDLSKPKKFKKLSDKERYNKKSWLQISIEKNEKNSIELQEMATQLYSVYLNDVDSISKEDNLFCKDFEELSDSKKKNLRIRMMYCVAILEKMSIKNKSKLEKLRSYLADIDAVPDDINRNDRIDLILDEYTIWNKKYKNENTINSIIKQILNDNQSQTKRSLKKILEWWNLFKKSGFVAWNIKKKKVLIKNIDSRIS